MRVFAQPQPAPVAPVAPVAPAVTPAQINTAGPTSAQAMYQAARAYRRELQGQLERLEEQASDLRREIAENKFADAAEKVAAEGRLVSLNARIPELDKALAAANQQVATAAAVPGATEEPPGRRDTNDAEMVIPIVFIVFVMGPLAAAAAWRWVRRGELPSGKAGKRAVALAETQQAQLERLTHTVDAMAEELERIGEGQRFLTRVLGDASTSMLAGGAQPLPVAAPERVPVYRQGEDPARG